MNISEEALGVLLNLLDVEAKALVLASGSVHHTGDEAILGALDTANAAANTFFDFDRVGESDARRAGFALDRFVDVGRCGGGGLVVSAEVVQSDALADVVLLAVEAELVHARGAFEAAGVGVVGVDDLVGGGVDFVGGGEFEDWWVMVSVDIAFCGRGCCAATTHHHFCGPCPTCLPSACRRWEWPWRKQPLRLRLRGRTSL